MTNAEAWFNIALRPWKPEGSLGRTAQDGHLDSHTTPELCASRLKGRNNVYIVTHFLKAAWKLNGKEQGKSTHECKTSHGYKQQQTNEAKQQEQEHTRIRNKGKQQQQTKRQTNKRANKQNPQTQNNNNNNTTPFR